MDMETTVWLDPRGDGEFIIIMPDEMTEVFDRDERMVRVESSMDGVGMHAAAKAPTFKSVVATAAALAREYQAVTCGDIKDVLVINHNCQLPKDDSFRRYDIATLAVGFYKCMLINGDALWRREPNGKLTRIIVMPDKLGTEKAREYMLEREKSVVMLYSPEREAALIAMRDRLASMAREFMRLINEEDIAALIETHGHKLLTGGS
jgi:hypothetical protein